MKRIKNMGVDVEYLLSVPEMKKASTDELVATMRKMSDIVLNRELDQDNIDLDSIMRNCLGDPSYENPLTMSEPFIVGESMIGMPSVMPKREKNISKGESVVPMIHVPGSEPCQAYSEDGDTFVDSMTVNLRGGRSISVHRVVPGMVASLHHYVGDGSGFRERQRIDAVRIAYDWHGKIVFTPLSESDALFNTPIMDKDR